MDTSPNLVEVAALIGEPSRAAILLSLLDGRTLPAGELASRAQVAPQTASSHLAKLVEKGLLEMESRGRYRYYRIANSEVAHAIESLITIAPQVKIRSLRESDQTKAIRRARTCYDHLAGVVGVALTEALLEQGLLVVNGKDYVVTDKGALRFKQFGIEVESMKKSGRRAFARLCLDWSERRHHVAGALGSAIVTRLFELGWIERFDSSRAVRVTETGKSGLSREFGVHL